MDVSPGLVERSLFSPVELTVFCFLEVERGRFGLFVLWDGVGVSGVVDKPVASSG